MVISSIRPDSPSSTPVAGGTETCVAGRLSTLSNRSVDRASLIPVCICARRHVCMLRCIVNSEVFLEFRSLGSLIAVVLSSGCACSNPVEVFVQEPMPHLKRPTPGKSAAVPALPAVNDLIGKRAKRNWEADGWCEAIISGLGRVLPYLYYYRPIIILLYD